MPSKIGTLALPRRLIRSFAFWARVKQPVQGHYQNRFRRLGLVPAPNDRAPFVGADTLLRGLAQDRALPAPPRFYGVQQKPRPRFLHYRSGSRTDGPKACRPV